MRVPLDRHRWKVALPIHVACCIAVLMFGQWWKGMIPMRFGPGGTGRGKPPTEGRPSSAPQAEGQRERSPGRSMRSSRNPRYFDFLRIATFELPIYLMVLCAAHAVLYYRRDQERAASLAHARLDALRMQLQPHFLFNTLNTIAGLVHEEPDKADAMLTSLSDLLRLTLHTHSERELPLSRELEFVERYLDIIHARFEEKLRFTVDVAPETHEALVPTFLLQPIVENAVEHGLQLRPDSGIVTICARRDAGLLLISIADNGIGLPEGTPPPEGVGLGNTRARLKELYGDRASLTLESGDGLTVKIAIPFHTRLTA
jgi:LytS/YehU family sensor histidine kinase